MCVRIFQTLRITIPHRPISHIIYEDVCSLYGSSMRYPFHVGEFEWDEDIEEKHRNNLWSFSESCMIQRITIYTITNNDLCPTITTRFIDTPCKINAQYYDCSPWYKNLFIVYGSSRGKSYTVL